MKKAIIYPLHLIHVSTVIVMMVMAGITGCREDASRQIERNIEQAKKLSEKGEDERAFELLLDAESYANDDVPPAVKMKLYHVLMAPYYYAYKIGNSKEYALKAVEAARAADSLNWLPDLLWNLCLTVENLDSAEMLLKECRDLSDKYGYDHMAGRARIFLAKTSILKGDTTEAQLIIDSLSANPDISGYIEIDISIQQSLLFESKGENIEAITQLNTIPRDSLSIQGKSNVYEILYKASRKSGQLEQALSYRDSLTLCKDSIASIKNSEKLSEREASFTKQLIRQQERQRRVRWIYGLSALFLISVIAFLGKNMAMKNRQLKLIEKINRLNYRIAELENRVPEQKGNDTMEPIMEKFRLTKEFFLTMPQSGLVNELNMVSNPDDIPKEKLTALTECMTGIFAEVCANLRQTAKEVKQDDAWLCVCSYIGLNKGVTGTVMRSSDDALRKRKSRIRQKLPLPLFELLFSK